MVMESGLRQQSWGRGGGHCNVAASNRPQALLKLASVRRRRDDGPGRYRDLAASVDVGGLAGQRGLHSGHVQRHVLAVLRRSVAGGFGGCSGDGEGERHNVCLHTGVGNNSSTP